MTARYYKGREVLKEYKQGRLVYEKSTSIPDYLCFTALEAGQFTLTIPAAVTSTYLSYVEWSKDGRTWNHRDNTSDIETIDVQVASGEKVYWRGSGSSTASGVTVATMSSKFSSDCRFDASGNIMSMLLADNFDGVTSLPSGRYTFAGLFHNCSTIVNAEHLLLSATTLRQDCYRSMFLNCTSLVTPPSLPATTLSPSCYLLMFGYCSSMTTAPALPATSATYYCYYRMFEGCTGLTSAPELPATHLFTSCYQRMFYNCTKLNYVKCMAEDLSYTNCVADWLNGVSSTGTFIQAEGVEWPRGASGIPTGWLAYDEGEDIPNDYTPCDYIYNSSTGGGGVDLGFKFRLLDYSVEAKFKQDDISNGMVIGTYTNNSGAIWFYNYSVAGSFRINACYSSGWHYNRDGFKPLDTNTHIIRYVGDADGCYQINDGTQSSSTNISTWAAEESTDRLFIFGRSQSQNTYKGGIYYLWVKDNSTDEYICNLIPCSRKSDGAAGFWDTAQKQFFTSTYWTAHNDNE